MVTKEKTHGLQQVHGAVARFHSGRPDHRDARKPSETGPRTPAQGAAGRSRGAGRQPDQARPRRAPRGSRQANDLALAKIPQVSGDAGQTYMDQQTGKVLSEAEKLAKKAGDSFVPVERILCALAMVKSPAKEALEAGGVSAQKPSTRRSTICARAAPPTRPAPRTPTRRWRNTPTTSPRRRPRRARSTRSSAATTRSAAPCRSCRAGPRTTRC